MKKLQQKLGELSYSEYVLCFYIIPGILGTIVSIGLIAYFIFGLDSIAIQVITLISTIGLCTSLVISILHKTEKADEMIEYYLARSNKATLVIFAGLCLFFMLVAWIGRLGNIHVTVNLIDCIDLIVMPFAFLYMAIFGISYKYIEAK